ncbi:protein phosphatase 2C domain-containing protein [uncultured Finegoldia sp.]|uniref:protein phosphatase 2C domain-containing protein n=1 Tax=uncultured Finegoldia sp. TaxID=328009 RepID=UPI0026080159|nr:protein phosphatase 2C domain-containing protein [uncultured Finegoldia sp.]
MEYFSISYKGKFRELNEDYYKNECFRDSQIFLIADGMGGCLFGDKASEIAVEEFLICFKKHYDEEIKIKDLIYGSIQHAGYKILEFSNMNNCVNNIGTTFIASIIKDDKLFLFNVGDSRAYLQNNYGLFQISKDHIVKNNDRYKNAVTRGLGFLSMDKPDYMIKDLGSEDQILMATDGFYKYIENSTINNILSSNYSVEEKCNILLNKVKGTSKDNITITLIKV